MQKGLVYLFLLFYGAVSAQDIKFYGMVQDSTGQGLTSASVVVAELKSHKFQGFSITDEQGLFEVALNKDLAYSVKVSYMGYRAVIDTVYTRDSDVFKKYILSPDPQQLKGVEVKYEMPVTVKGDTIIYNADSFTNGNERKLGDVLKKMPGIEVEKDGTVKVEGKAVKKVMVEGKNFFEGDSKLASKNIPADAVKKVEVLRGYNENAQLKSFEDNDESYAINIRLKEGKKRFWFGDITAGGGTDEHYLLHPKLFYYSPQKTYNFIGDLNNTGSAPLSFMDYFKMTGGMGRSRWKASSEFENAASSFGFSLHPNDKALAAQTRFGAFNYNISLGKKTSWEGFILLNRQKTETRTAFQKEYVLTGVSENSFDTNRQEHFSAVLKNALQYQPGLNLTLKYDMLLKYNDIQQNDEILSNIRPANQNIDESRNFSTDQELEIYKSLKNNDLITYDLQHNYSNKRPVLEIISPGEFFSTSSLIQMSPQNTYDLLQNKYIDQQKITSVFDYYKVLNKVSHLDFTAGQELVWQNFSSRIYQITDNGSRELLNSSLLINDARYTFTDFYAGAYYKLLAGNWILRPGFSAHYYHLKDKQSGDVRRKNQYYLLPAVKIKYKFKRGARINFSYRLSNSYPGIQKFARAYVLNSYNSLSGGNRDLQNLLKHSFSIRFFKFSMQKFYHLFTQITYERSLHPLRSYTQLLQTDRISYPVNMDNADKNLTATANFSKRYIYWKYRLSTQYTYLKYYGIINGNELANISQFQNYQASINSNLSGFFNFDLTYGLRLNRFDNSRQNTTYITENPTAGIELRMFKNTTQLNLKYEYYNYRNRDNSVHNRYAFLSADLYFQKDGSPWEFVLSGRNLLNNRSLDKESLTDIYIATSRYRVMPRYWMLKLTYKL